MHICMDWHAINFDWNRARAFLVTAEEGSLSAAARALGMAQPTLGRQVAAFEREVGVTLFQRVGRGLELTAPGRELLDHVRMMADGANRMALAASGQATAIDGTIRISASAVYAAYRLPEVFAGLRHTHPELRIEIVATTEVSDLRRRAADIAVRNTRPTDPDLIAKRLPDDQGILFAAPEYLDRIGRPQSVANLGAADFISFDNAEQLIALLTAKGVPATERNLALLSDDHLVQLALVRRGLGIGIFPTAMGDADPSLERAVPDFDPIDFPVWVVAHREVSTSRKVRLVFDSLVDHLGRHGAGITRPS